MNADHRSFREALGAGVQRGGQTSSGHLTSGKSGIVEDAETRLSLAAPAEVGPGSRVCTSTPVGLAIDAQRRSEEVAGWFVDPLLQIIKGLPADQASHMALVAAVRLAAHFSAADAEEFLRVLARRMVEAKRSENEKAVEKLSIKE
jgi:hypothetical protein